MSTFGDIELALSLHLADLAYCVRSTPPDLQDRLASGGVLRIQRIGGGNDKTNDYPRVSIQAFMLKDPTDPRASLNLAEQVRDRMRVLADVVNGVLIDNAETDSGPVSIPWPDQNIQVHQAIYRVTTRSL